MGAQDKAARGRERRYFPRWYTRLLVSYGSPGTELSKGEGRDVSEGGIGFSGDKTFPVGADLEVRFRLDSPTSDWFQANAVVRHVEQNKMGVQFVGLHEEHRNRILNTIYQDIAARRR